MCGGKVISLGLKILCYRSNSISCRQVSQLSHAGIFYLLIFLVIFLTSFIWILDIFLYPFAKAHIGWLQQSMSSRPGCTLNGLSSVSNFIVALNTAETPQPQLFRFKECVIRLNGPCWRLFTLSRVSGRSGSVPSSSTVTCDLFSAQLPMNMIHAVNKWGDTA